MASTDKCEWVARSTRKRCKKDRKPGSKYCYMHIHSARQRALADVNHSGEQIEEDIKKKYSQFGRMIKIDPIACLLQSIYEAAGNVAFYRERLNQLGDGRTRFDQEGRAVWEGFYGPDHLGDDAPHVLLNLYNQERDRLVAYSARAVQAGLAQKLVRIEQSKGRMVAMAVLTALRDPKLSLTKDQMKLAQALVANELRGIEDEDEQEDLLPGSPSHDPILASQDNQVISELGVPQ